MAGYVQVLTTAPTAEEATTLAHGLIMEKLGAGAQIIGPIRSIYWWQGSKRDEMEWQLVIKTTAGLFSALETYIKANHSYVTPEIIATEIVAGSAEYLDWISAETTRTDASS
ncbi:divalent-cation tolerance protein CutA [Nonomuraea sp. NPDC004354]